METFVQPKITGYRQLTEAEATLMNKVKQKGVELDLLIEELYSVPGIDDRWVEAATMDLQVGLMKLTRAIARPTSF